MSYYWDDVEIGHEVISNGRTITETDIVNFGTLTGDLHPMHFDEEFCRENSHFKTRVAHGVLGLSYAMGLLHSFDLFTGTALAFYGLERYEFRRPILIGDTIKAKLTVVDKKESSKPDRGLVTQRMAIMNQRGEEVQVGQHTTLVRRKP